MKKIALMLSCIIIVSGITSCKRSFECACEGKPGILGGTQGPPKATIEIKIEKQRSIHTTAVFRRPNESANKINT